MVKLIQSPGYAHVRHPGYDGFPGQYHNADLKLGNLIYSCCRKGRTMGM
jgi:hypothetical protein